MPVAHQDMRDQAARRRPRLILDFAVGEACPARDDGGGVRRTRYLFQEKLMDAMITGIFRLIVVPVRELLSLRSSQQ